MTLKKIGSLEIEPEAKEINYTFVIIQRIIIALLTLFLFLSFLGLTGSGPFAKRTVTENGLTVQYPIFMRKHASSTLKIIINSENLTHDTAKVGFSRDYLNHFHIEQFIPNPIKSETSGNNIIYYFTVVDKNSLSINLLINPQDIGFARNFLTVNDNSIEFSQFIYP